MLKYEKNAGSPMTDPMMAELYPYVKEPRAAKKVTTKL
jgi:hypothetical protein